MTNCIVLFADGIYLDIAEPRAIVEYLRVFIVVYASVLPPVLVSILHKHV